MNLSCNSNTTLVKVKSVLPALVALSFRIQIQHLLKLNLTTAKGNTPYYCIQIQHLLKLNKYADKKSILVRLFKYNTC